MMISYPGLLKMKTRPVVYQDVLAASDLGTLEQLKEISSKRKAVEDSINGSSSITEALAREMSGGLTSRYEQDIQKLEQYLPLLENLCDNIGNKETGKVVRWTSNPKIIWSSALANSSIFYPIDNVHFEHSMTLFFYASLLHERALEVLSSDLVQSAALFRKAAGVYNYIAGKVLPFFRSWEKPPEATASVCSIMGLICMADAQAVTARKAEENGNTGGLLAKLHLGVKEFLDQAINMLPTATKKCGDLSSRLQDFLLSCKMLHELMSYKYHVESLKNNGKIGIAIAVLRRALATKKYTPKEASWRLVSKQTIDDFKVLLQKYERENEFVWYEKIPSSDDGLPSPQAVRIVHVIPYQPQKLEKKLVFKTPSVGALQSG